MTAARPGALSRLPEPVAPGRLVERGAILVIGATGHGGGAGGAESALGREIVGQGRVGGERLSPEPGGRRVVVLEGGETGELGAFDRVGRLLGAPEYSGQQGLERKQTLHLRDSGGRVRMPVLPAR